MSYVLTVGLTHVRAEFNTVFPHRDKTSDGWIGDTRHQAEKSGHNPDRTGNAEYRDGDALDEVRAIDVDKDLRDASGQGVTMEKVIQYLVTKARSGAYVPFRYFIYNRRIWERSTGWKTRSYTGSNPHDEHAHFSGDYTQTADNWTGLLGLASLTKKPSGGGSTGGGGGSSLPHYRDGSRENSQSKNNRGTDVKTLQVFIGPEQCGAADGEFGPHTTRGVRWYQDMRGLHVDGVAGPKTWAPILKALHE